MNSIGLFCVLTLAALASARSIPIQSGLVMYQAYPGYYAPKRSMYIQYSGNQRSASLQEGAVAAFAAGDKIAAGTYFQGNPNEDPSRKSGEGAENDEEFVSSVAEAYPAARGEQPTEDELPEVYGAPPRRTAKANTPNEAEARKKTPKVALAAADAEDAVEDDDDEEEDEEEDEDEFAYAKTNRKNSPKAAPSNGGGGGSSSSNTYFPIHFGEASGGAIAIANSYSKGKGGTAVSRATAYGSPAGTKLKKRIAQN